MQKSILFYLIIFALSALLISAILPYPIFSSYTNINNQNAFEINNFKETEIKNNFNISAKILDFDFDDINQIIPIEFELIDLNSEETLQATRIGGNNHADIIFDQYSKIRLQQICQKFSWERRPVLVKLNENAYLPASLICFPHGYNNHFCLHFKNSKTHGTNKSDNTSQKTIKTAKKLGIKYLESL